MATERESNSMSVDEVLSASDVERPLTVEERERIALVLTSLKAGTDQVLNDLLSATEHASDAALTARRDLERRHARAIILAAVGTFIVTVAFVLLMVVLATRGG